MRPNPGAIVLVDWRDALQKEPNKRRPAVVVEAEGLFAEEWPNILLVPLTDDKHLAIPAFSTTIEPTSENGCTKQCHALSSFVTTTSLRRVELTPSRITSEQLRSIRMQAGVALGIETP